jgi:YVTN family beta-propeller protein
MSSPPPSAHNVLALGAGTEDTSGVPQRRQATRRFLATVLFTDIVGSTARAAELGDRAWRDLLERHNALVRRELKAFDGREMDTAGDGFFAVFETPERAVRCAEAIITAVVPIDLLVRAGVHMGECEVIGGKVGGMAVNIGARVAAKAGPGEVLVSGSVRDLMTGSGRRFAGGDLQELKGVEEWWRVYRLVPEILDVESGASHRPSMIPLWTRRRRRRLLAAATVGALAAVAVPVVVLHNRADPIKVVEANTVGVLRTDGRGADASVSVGQRPTDIAAGAGAAWVTNSTSNTVSRIDPRTHAVVPIQVGSQPVAIAVGAGAVWVADSGDATVSRIDTRTYTVTTIPVRTGPSDVVVARGSVWVTSALDASVSEIDPETSRVVHTVQVGTGPAGIAYGGGSLWVANQADGTVTPLDPATRRTEPAIRVGNGPVGIAVGAGAVWVTNNIDGSLSRIDLTDQSVTTRTVATDGGAHGVAVSGATVWVSNEYGGTLSRIDAAEFTVDATVRTNGAPLGLTFVDGRLWFATAGGGAAHRGGVLRIAAGNIGDGNRLLDPVDTYNDDLWRMLAITNDGLVGFRRVAGAPGGQLVPDLATSVPRPSDGGRTYVFHLRSNVRYSTGQLVRGSDIRHGIERMFQHGRGPLVYYEMISGAPQCQEAPAPCDLRAGIVADERAHTLTFHLTRPEPEFLYRLALPFAYAVPSDIPVPLPDGAQTPATGPYEVASYTPRRSDGQGATTRLGRLVLVRNPHFRQWSAAAQPDGYPDHIVLDIGLTPAEATKRVAEGRADLLLGNLAPQAIEGITARYATRLHTNTDKEVHDLAFNTLVPPFDNQDARRAVAYAMDRGALSGDPASFGYGEVTCQMLPPNFNGHVTYCPYTLHAGGSRAWSAPDLGKAQRLVELSGTKGARVRILSDQADSLGARRIVSLLRSLTYRVSLRVVPDGNTAGFALARKTGWQAVLSGWIADYPAASNFIDFLGSCRGHESFNLSHFCRLQPQIDRALESQATDPARANTSWAALDRALVDEAPIVPFSTGRRVDFTSERVGNYQYNPQWRALIAQLWVH